MRRGCSVLYSSILSDVLSAVALMAACLMSSSDRADNNLIVSCIIHLVTPALCWSLWTSLFIYFFHNEHTESLGVFCTSFFFFLINNPFTYLCGDVFRS